MPTDSAEIPPEGPKYELTQLAFAVANMRRWLDLKLKTGRYSFGFAVELARHHIDRVYNVHAIFDEIGRLEGTDKHRSLTKPAEPFKCDILRGLWHKHHLQTYFLAKNLILEIQSDRMKNALTPYFVAGEIAYVMTIGAYEQRAAKSRMTGQWIVFEKVNGANYYLTLGDHGEDVKIKTRVDVYRQIDNQLAAAHY